MYFAHIDNETWLYYSSVEPLMGRGCNICGTATGCTKSKLGKDIIYIGNAWLRIQDAFVLCSECYTKMKELEKEGWFYGASPQDPYQGACIECGYSDGWAYDDDDGHDVSTSDRLDDGWIDAGGDCAVCPICYGKMIAEELED